MVYKSVLSVYKYVLGACTSVICITFMWGLRVT
jgi:hypothetical protein